MIVLAVVVPDRPGGFRTVMQFIQQRCPGECIDVPRPDETPDGRFEVRVTIDAADADELQARLMQQGWHVSRV